MASPVYITPEGYQKLRDEIAQLWKVERPRVTAEVEAAAALGDRSENAEYIYGKKRLREIDRRLKYLSGRIDKVKVMHLQAQQQSVDKVGFGAWVVLEDEDGGTHTYRIVGPDESDATAGWISTDSPVGRALLGKEPGDDVDVQRPRGPMCFTVVSIHYGERPEQG